MTDNGILELILDKVSGLDTKVSSLDDKVSGLDTKVNSLDDKVSNLETDMQDVKEKVAKTNLILDNEIRVNIQRIAEGHLDLSRNLHDAMRPSTEVEMLAVKVRMLESEVKEIKHRIS